MKNLTEDPTPVIRHLIPEDKRLAVTAELFGAHWPLQVEPVIYGITSRMAEDYHGGYWQFYSLDNGGFYMAPDDDRAFTICSDNYFIGDLSADALGITACLYAFSHCSFSRDERFGRLMADHYHRLRAYMFTHPEVAAILGAID